MIVPATITVATIQRALNLAEAEFDALTAQLKMAPQPRPLRRPDRLGVPREAAVLLLLYPKMGVLHFALMRRPEYDGVHSGQISLPGGRREGDELAIQTALRETCEEVGLCDGISILGQLSLVYIPPSDFNVQPVVGYYDHDHSPQWQLDSREVAEILEVPVSILFEDDRKGQYEQYRPDVQQTLIIPYYQIGQHRVWGATAAMLSDFEQRLRHVSPTDSATP